MLFWFECFICLEEKVSNFMNFQKSRLSFMKFDFIINWQRGSFDQFIITLKHQIVLYICFSSLGRMLGFRYLRSTNGSWSRSGVPNGRLWGRTPPPFIFNDVNYKQHFHYRRNFRWSDSCVRVWIYSVCQFVYGRLSRGLYSFFFDCFKPVGQWHLKYPSLMLDLSAYDEFLI